MPRGWMLVNDGYGCGYTSRDMLQAPFGLTFNFALLMIGIT